MVSVIVPVYNVEPYLEEAIESIINQSYKELEIILVDDGSTDGSGNICDKYQKSDSRIKVIHQENRGLSGARNAGLDICEGDIIAFLDPDDAFCKDAIFKMTEAMTESGAEIVECNFANFVGRARMNEGGLKRRPKAIRPEKNREGLYTKKEALLMHCSQNLATTVWNKIYKQEIWKDLRFREGQNYEDLDIILPLVNECEQIYILDEKLIMRRIRKGSITSTNTLKNVKDRILAAEHYFEFIREHTPDMFGEEDQRKVMENLANYLFQTFFKTANSRVKEKKQILEYIRSQISKPEITEAVKTCGLKVRMASFVYNHFPFYIGLMTYSMFSIVNKIVKKVL